MNNKKELENPLSTIIKDGGFTGIFRTIGCIGDSLASGEHESQDKDGKKGFHDYYEYSWGQYIARRCGSTVYNFSVGGLTAKEFFTLARYQKCFTKEKACQAYIIGLGVNDGKNIEGIYKGGFGQLPDTKNENDTFVGAYVQIILQIRALVPKARIFVITPPRRDNIPENACAMEDKIACFLRELPNYFEFLYVIDLRKYEEVHDNEFRKRYHCGGHLNAMGYMRSADIISTYIDYIIRNNYEDFKQVGFICKDVHNCAEKW
jgi:lysophospholipase L1-like esterase